MSLLDDFKTTIGETGTSNDQYYIDYFLKPALDRASVLSTNIKKVVITLTSGTLTYDLTDANIASPAVGAAGVQDLVFDGDYQTALRYKRDFYIKGLTDLYIVSSDDTYTGTLTLKYNAFFTKPTTDPTETDAPTNLWPAVIKYAQGLYRLDQLADGSSSAGVERKKEDNLEISYGSVDSQRGIIMDSIKMAENMMINNGASSAFNFFSIQVV